jgi:predicted DNA-binding protein with PD1-like motif
VGIEAYAFRLTHGVDLREGIERCVAASGINAGWLSSCVGGLSGAVLRMPGAVEFLRVEGSFEIVSATGTLSPDGSHIHLSIGDNEGVVRGGHLDYGSTVRLTAEIVILSSPHLSFSRAHDPDTGFRELVVKERRLVSQRGGRVGTPPGPDDTGG